MFFIFIARILYNFFKLYYARLGRLKLFIGLIQRIPSNGIMVPETIFTSSSEYTFKTL